MATIYQNALAGLSEDKKKKAQAQALAGSAQQRALASTAATAGIKGAVGVGGTVAGAAPMGGTNSVKNITGGNAFQNAIAQAESVKPKGTAAGQAQISTLPWTGGQAQITNPVGTPGPAQISTLPGAGQSGKGQSIALGNASAAQGQGQNSYISFARKDPNFQSGMSGEDQANWDAIGRKYAAGDSSWMGDTNAFREDGKWGSYTDANGNINGWLMAADGTGGYAPVFGGKVGETGYKPGTVFYAPDGTAYTMAQDGTLSKSGTVDWFKYGQYIGPKAGYQDSDFWVVENGKYKKYTTQTAPQEVLNAQGYYRDSNGLVMPIDSQYYIQKALASGAITPEQAALAQEAAKGAKEAGIDPTKMFPDGIPGTGTGGGNGGGVWQYPTGQNGGGNGGTGGGGGQTGGGNGGTGGGGQAAGQTGGGTVPPPPASTLDPTQQTPWQNYLAQWEYGEAPQWTGSGQTMPGQWEYGEAPQWTGGQDETWKDMAGYDYGTAPEWEGTPYQEQRDKALETAQSMQYTDDEYAKKRDQLVEDAMKPWEGSQYDPMRDELLAGAMEEYGGNQYDPLRDKYLEEAAGMEWEGSQYDPMRDKYLEQYGEEWQGSPYQQERDDALRKAQNMQWDYDPNTDPVWQALQKQYRREGDRATQQALGQAAARTGGVPSSYAMTAASQAGDYYAAQLSDRLPQVYQDAYNRYLQEFQRQMGISDQYAGFDDREYARWADQQGRNLDLADRYNQYGQQEYGQFMDKFGRKMDVSGMYNQLGQQDYGQFMDRANQQLQGADRYNQYGRQDYSDYMDRVNQQLAGADRYDDYDKTGYQRYLDLYGRQMDAVDRYNQYGEQEYDKYRDRLGQFNTDRDFRHGVNRENVADAERATQTAYQQYLDSLGQYNKDKAMSYEQYRAAVEDARYNDETAYQRYLDSLDQYNKDKAMSYGQYRDAVEDARYADETRWNREQYIDNKNYERWMDQQDLNYRERQFAQQLLEYADSQKWKAAEWEQYLREYGDQMSEKERQWAYKVYQDQVSQSNWERQFAYGQQQDALAQANWEQQFRYGQQQDAMDNQYRDNVWQQSLREYEDDLAQQAWNNEYKLGGMSGGSGSGGSGSGGTGRYSGGGYDYSGGDDDGDGSFNLNMIGNRASQDWVALDNNQRVSWQELYTLVENGDVEEYYQNGKYYYRWKNLEVPEGKKKEATPKVVYENRGGR